MPTYKVPLERTVIERIDILIEASSSEEASEKASALRRVMALDPEWYPSGIDPDSIIIGTPQLQ